MSALLVLYIAVLLIWPNSRLWETVGFVLAAAAVLSPKHLLRSLLILLGFLILCFLLVQTPLVQNWLAGQASARLSKGLGTRVQVKHVNLSFFSKLQMEGVYSYGSVTQVKA